MGKLRADPGSHTAAAAEGWEYPFPRLEAMVADLFDAAAPHTYKRPSPYPRPMQAPTPTRRHGNAAGRSPEEVKALLRERFGQSKPPV